MDLFIPYAYTLYDGEAHFGVFSTRELAEAAIAEQKLLRQWQTYDIYVVQLDTKDTF